MTSIEYIIDLLAIKACEGTYKRYFMTSLENIKDLLSIKACAGTYPTLLHDVTRVYHNFPPDSESAKK